MVPGLACRGGPLATRIIRSALSRGALSVDFEVDMRMTRERMQTVLAFQRVAVAGNAILGDALAVPITFVGAKRPTRPDS